MDLRGSKTNQRISNSNAYLNHSCHKVVLAKSLLDVSYEDIKRLMEDRVEESEILDYKQDLISEDSLINHVCAFANTRGGYIIFGIKESGDGGYPIEMNGVDIGKIHKEKLENIILAHVTPRLMIQIKQIPIPESERAFLIIRIPDSYLRPHYSKDSKYYKRYNFKSDLMTEREIADLYYKRFLNHDQINQYLEKILPNERSNAINGNILIIPSHLEQGMIDATNLEKIRWFDTISLKPYVGGSGQSIVPCRPIPSSYGLTAKIHSGDGHIDYLHIHRNGCIHLSKDFHCKLQLPKYSLNARDLSLRLMETLEFACQTMRHYNYFGEVKILVVLIGPRDTFASELAGVPYSDKLNAKIERQFPLEYVEQNFTEVSACIMHEVVNYYGLPRCKYFDNMDSWNP